MVASLSLALLAGCASTAGGRDESSNYDPLEPLNRQVFAFNRTADKYLLKPLAEGYDYVLPSPVKSSITNFFRNVNSPILVLNHLLQGNLAEAGKQSGRFVMNTTLGMFGLLDPATSIGLERQSATFDQTFGKWGVPSGPYLMLPFLGPSSARGVAGIGARFETDLIWNYLDDERSIRDKLLALEIINTRQRLLSIDRMIDRAPDPYIFVRESYRQNVEFEIRGPGGADEDIGLDFEDELWDDEDWTDDAPPEGDR
ncbi:VacJ family lipoprotein [Wenzhouxiangella sp. XN24]|uniref:MlaA family lipoprotein n=1 Tax=Wenzhouxiangella sp. XN24 TaxID=2713569 RepID=UPI0013EC9575|nr:VacJ family lipoprotein [Wenzhouxiangella sp. XN24]NGX15444.1 VacJ family lipoprotein [Wenzhouxiangella sp. XN24]